MIALLGTSGSTTADTVESGLLPAREPSELREGDAPGRVVRSLLFLARRFFDAVPPRRSLPRLLRRALAVLGDGLRPQSPKHPPRDPDAHRPVALPAPPHHGPSTECVPNNGLDGRVSTSPNAGIVWQMFGYIVRSSSGIQLVTTRPVAVLLQKRRMGSPRRLDPVRS